MLEAGEYTEKTEPEPIGFYPKGYNHTFDPAQCSRGRGTAFNPKGYNHTFRCPPAAAPFADLRQFWSGHTTCSPSDAATRCTVPET